MNSGIRILIKRNRSFIMKKFILSAMAACLVLSMTACGDSESSSENSDSELKVKTGAAYYMNAALGVSAYDSDPAQTPGITKSGSTYTFASFDVTGDGSVTVSGTIVVTISVDGTVWDAALTVSDANPFDIGTITCHDINAGSSGTFAVDDDERDISYLYNLL
jgi:hypothetical protein